MHYGNPTCVLRDMWQVTVLAQLLKLLPAWRKLRSFQPSKVSARVTKNEKDSKETKTSSGTLETAWPSACSSLIQVRNRLRAVPTFQRSLSLKEKKIIKKLVIARLGKVSGWPLFPSVWLWELRAECTLGRKDCLQSKSEKENNWGFLVFENVCLLFQVSGCSAQTDFVTWMSLPDYHITFVCSWKSCPHQQ